MKIDKTYKYVNSRAEEKLSDESAHLTFAVRDLKVVISGLVSSMFRPHGSKVSRVNIYEIEYLWNDASSLS